MLYCYAEKVKKLLLYGGGKITQEKKPVSNCARDLAVCRTMPLDSVPSLKQSQEECEEKKHIASGSKIVFATQPGLWQSP